MTTNQSKTDSVIKKNQKGISAMSAVTSYIAQSKYPKLVKIGTLLNSIMFIVALITYIVLGCTMHNWAKTWMVILFAPIIPSIFSAIGKGRFCSFLFFFLPLGIYLAIGMNVANGWHPYWVLLLSIPIYYGIFIPIDKHLDKIKCKQETEEKNNY